jgi:hypothetical protein
VKNVHLEGEERVGKSYEDRRLVKLSHHHVYQPTSVVQINLLVLLPQFAQLLLTQGAKV